MGVITRHFREDRIERAAYIAQTVGFGDVYVRHTYTREGYERPITIEVTDTGVIVIRGDDRAIITMYIATTSDLIKMFKASGLGRVPTCLINKAKKNMTRGYVNAQPNHHDPKPYEGGNRND